MINFKFMTKIIFKNEDTRSGIEDDYEWQYIFIKINNYKLIDWFTDSGEWFCYIRLFKTIYRFSSAGYIKNKIL